MVEAPARKSKKDATVERTVHPNWMSLIQFCGALHQGGSVVIRVEAGIPIKRLASSGTKKDIAFKDQLTPPKFVKEVNNGAITVHISAKWNNFMDFIRDKIPYGQVCFSVAGGEPAKLVEKYSFHDIRFAHPETFPQDFYIFNEQPQ